MTRGNPIAPTISEVAPHTRVPNDRASNKWIEILFGPRFQIDLHSDDQFNIGNISIVRCMVFGIPFSVVHDSNSITHDCVFHLII